MFVGVCDDDDEEEEEEKAEPKSDDDYDDNDRDYEDDDEEYARNLNRAMNGSRWSSRRRGSRRGGGGYAEDDEDDDMAGANRAPRVSQRSVAKVSYVESEDDDSEASGGGRARLEPLAAFTDGYSVVDEVEKVLGHREAAAGTCLEGSPKDPWATREMYIKWKNFSFIHCTWETKASLADLNGFKRVLNYIKKVGGEGQPCRFERIQMGFELHQEGRRRRPVLQI
jgi:chromodomain-helicase-DNA-binding protein 1